MSDLVRIDREDGFAIVTLDRAEKRNALSRALRDAIVAALDRLEADAAVRALVLTGAGTAFCAGFDRAELAGGDPAAIFREANAYHRRVYGYPKPLVAAVNGQAVAGGCDLAAMCDIRIAAESAVFGQPQVRLGIPAAYDLMSVVIGPGAAREMCLCGRLYTAREAQALGLVQRVVPDGALSAEAAALAREIAGLPAGAAAATKRRIVATQPPLFAD